MKKRVLGIMFLVAAFVLLFSTPVLAIADPDTYQINNVWVYRNVIEDGDSIYLVDFTLAYDSEPTETATEAFYVQLLDGSIVLAETAPYSYENDGWVRGCVAFYFAADEAPVWGEEYTVKLAGVPTLSWSGSPPSDTVSSFDLWQDSDPPTSNQLFSERILWLAYHLDSEWGATYTLIEYTSSGVYLSTEGVTYFATTIPNLGDSAIYALADRSIVPELIDHTYTQAYSNTLVTNITDSPLDMTDLGTEFGLSRGATTAALYYGAVMFFAVLLVRRLQTYKPVMLLCVPLVWLGAFLGAPLVIPILFTFLAFALIAYALFYKPSTA